MTEFLQNIPVWIIILIVLWDSIWKLIALWKSARNNHLIWFIFIGIINSVGILPLIYILIDKHETDYIMKSSAMMDILRKGDEEINRGILL